MNIKQNDKKYFGNKNENYQEKLSSVILWNCEHEDKCLTPEL